MHRDCWQTLLREGQAERVSTEYFNRNKGTNFWVEIRSLGSEQWVLAQTLYYPNACPSEGSYSFSAAPLSKVKEMLTKNPDLGLWDLPEVLEKKYMDMQKQGTSSPICPHCGRLWD